MHQLGCYAASTARFFAAAIFLASVFTLAPLRQRQKTVLDLSWVAATAQKRGLVDISHFVCAVFVLPSQSQHKTGLSSRLRERFYVVDRGLFIPQRHATVRISRDRETRLKISQQRHLNFMWVRAVAIVAAALPRTAAFARNRHAHIRGGRILEAAADACPVDRSRDGRHEEAEAARVVVQA